VGHPGDVKNQGSPAAVAWAPNRIDIFIPGSDQKLWHRSWGPPDMGTGIGGYNLQSDADQAFAFDFNGTGKLDHVVLYRPGTGAVFVVRRSAPVFQAVFAQGDPGAGIGGFDLLSTADRGFAFDFKSSGKPDHLVFYRPGTGAVFIVENTAGSFQPVYAQAQGGSGIGGFDLLSADDQGFAFDFAGAGKLDHLVFYRPGGGAIFILKNNGGSFQPVLAQGQGGSGIGGFDLGDPADRGFAFDFTSSGKADHLVFYRPGTGGIFVLKNAGPNFQPVYAQGQGGAGIGGYNLLSTADQAFAFDFKSNGKLDHIVLYRPGQGAIFIVKASGNTFVPVFAQGDPGNGIGGYDLTSANDRMFAYDFDGSGKLDHLLLYRPGAGTVWVLKLAGGIFSPVFVN